VALWKAGSLLLARVFQLKIEEIFPTHLVVSTLLHGHHAAHTDGATTVGHTPGEGVHGAGFVLASQPALIALAVRSNVQL